MDKLSNAERLLKVIESITGLKLESKDKRLLEEALRHPSVTCRGKESYQKLEFLGDAVFGLVVANLIFKKFPQFSEGELSRLKANLVSEANLSRLSKKINLVDYLSFDRRQITHQRAISSIEAEALEAVVGALHLSSQPQSAFRLIKFLFKGFRFSKHFAADPKSTFQEKLAALRFGLPEYRLIKKMGKAHRPLFEVEVLVNNFPWAKARGRSKKEAETKAALKALKKLNKQTRAETQKNANKND